MMQYFCRVMCMTLFCTVDISLVYAMEEQSVTNFQEEQDNTDTFLNNNNDNSDTEIYNHSTNNNNKISNNSNVNLGTNNNPNVELDADLETRPSLGNDQWIKEKIKALKATNSSLPPDPLRLKKKSIDNLFKKPKCPKELGCINKLLKIARQKNTPWSINKYIQKTYGDVPFKYKQKLYDAIAQTRQNVIMSLERDESEIRQSKDCGKMRKRLESRAGGQDVLERNCPSLFE